MHSNEPAIRKYTGVKSFSAEIPSWIELASPKAFFDYFQDKFVDMDVMLIWDEVPSNFKELERFCQDKKWKCTERDNVTGSEAMVTILYDLDWFDYEVLTRAKTQFLIVTIQEKER